MNIIGGLSITDSVQDGPTTPELDGPVRVKTVVLGGNTYAYIAGYGDNGIQILKVEADGTFTPIGTFADSAGTFMAGPRYLDVIESGGNYFLVVPGSTEDGLTTLKITATGVNQGQLTLVDTIQNDANNDLDYANVVESFTTPNGSFVAVSAYYSDAVSIYRISANGTMTLVDSATDSDNIAYLLNGTEGISVHKIGAKTFLYVSSGVESGVTVFEIANSGSLSYVTSQAIPGADLNGVEAASFNGIDYLIVPDSNGGTFNIYTLDASGVPTFASNYDVYADQEVWRNYFAEVIEIEGVNYILSQGAADNSVGIYTIDDSGNMSLISLVRNVPNLDGANDVTYVAVGGRHFILVPAYDTDRVTAVEIGGSDDILAGTADDDNIVGLGGDDDMIGRGGNDMMLGGDGDDVLSGRQGNDDLDGGNGADVLIGGAGNDTLDGGAGGDVLIGGVGIDYVTYANSTVAVTVNLATGTGTGGDAQEDFLNSIEGLIGSSFADTLTGGDGRNFIRGGTGNDIIDGGDGNDQLTGNSGADTISGGNGFDVISLGGGADFADGGNGNDRINGGGGSDILLGGLGDDTLLGAGGADTINGGRGDDRLNGGGGPDVFVFVAGDGNDIVSAFTDGADFIDFSGHSSFNDIGTVLASSFEFGGDTIIVDGTNSITLEGVSKTDLDTSDFIFVI